MNQYLLLRDNKQTGPYTASDLIAKGLKPYDLVWWEGKSAGWRYPGELPELAPHAPLVEEQPFDRFYKRPSQTVTAVKKEAVERGPIQKPEEKNQPVERPKATIEAFTGESPLIPFPKGKVVRTRNIFVTLPGSPPVAESQKPVPIPIEITKSVSPVEEEPIIPEVSKPSSVAKEMAGNIASPLMRENNTIENILPSPDKIRNQRVIGFSPVIRVAVAVCLLLGGVIIGLAISTSKKTPEQEQLDALVKQIQEKRLGPSKPESQAITATTPPIIQETPSASLAAEGKEPAGYKEITQKQPVQQVVQQTSTPTDLTSGNNPTKSEKRADISAPPKVAEKAVAEDPEKVRESLNRLVAVKANAYKTGVLGGISNLQLTVSNNSLYPIQSILVEVKYLGPEKKVVNKQLVTISALGPGEQKTQEVPSSRRGVTVLYSIVRINSLAAESPQSVL